MAALLGADPILLLWLLGGLKVASPGRELPTTTYCKTSVCIYVRTDLIGLSAHKKLLDVSRRRTGSCPATLHVASAGHATNAADACLRKQYVLQSSKCLRAQRKLSNFVELRNAKFAEFPFHALR